jgi:hypothetical protein
MPHPAIVWLTNNAGRGAPTFGGTAHSGQGNGASLLLIGSKTHRRIGVLNTAAIQCSAHYLASTDLPANQDCDCKFEGKINMTRMTLFVTIVLLTAATVAHAAEGSIHQVVVPGGGTLGILVPQGWSLRRAPKGKTSDQPTIEITDKQTTVKLRLTFDPGLFKDDATPEEIDRMVKKSVSQYVDEKSISIQRVKTDQGFGAYTTFTDASLVNVTPLPPDKFLYITSGIFIVGKEAVVFRLLSKQLSSSNYLAAMKLATEGITVRRR